LIRQAARASRIDEFDELEEVVLKKKTLLVLALVIGVFWLSHASAGDLPRGLGKSGKWTNPQETPACPPVDGKKRVCAVWVEDGYPGLTLICCVHRELLPKNSLKDCQPYEEQDR